MSLFADPTRAEATPSRDTLSVSETCNESTKAVGAAEGDQQFDANAPAFENAQETAADICTLYSEDLSVGDFWETALRKITEGDVHTFANLTGDHTPLHEQGSGQTPFGKPVVHGLLGLSILAGLGADFPRTSTLALVGIEDWQFLAPVFFGDCVKARNEIVSIEQHGRRAVKVRWLRQLLGESGRVLQQGCFITLVGSRARRVSKPR